MQPFRIQRIPFPDSLRGKVLGMTQQMDGYCLIVLDSLDTMEEQAAGLLHELGHVALDHFSSSKSIQDVEAEAEAFAARITVDELAALLEWEQE